MIFTYLVLTLSCVVPATLSCSCYSFHTDINPWHDSRKRCLDNGGDLVSMETLDEWSFINSKIQQRRDMDEWHIGLTNLTGKWRWLSNYTLTYDKWQIGEPEKVPFKRYVTMAKNWPIGSRGMFNSLRDDIRRARICEYKKGCTHEEWGCNGMGGTSQPITLPSTTLFTKENKIVLPRSTVFRTDVHFLDSTSVSPTSLAATKVKERKPYFVVVLAIVLGAIIIGTCCIVIIACGLKRKNSAKRHENNTMSPSRCKHPMSDKNANGTQQAQKLVNQSEGNAGKTENQVDDNNVASNVDASDVIDFSLQFNFDYSSTSDDNADQDLSEIDVSYGLSNGGPVLYCDHNNEKPQNGYINGISNDAVLYTNNANDFRIVKSAAVSPTKEAQYASIVAVQTNPKCNKVVCQTAKHPVLKTFSPVYEENGTNIAHTEYPVYATINKPTLGKPVMKTTTPQEEVKYAELADFDNNARHKTKLPPPYEETNYAVVQIPN